MFGRDIDEGFPKNGNDQPTENNDTPWEDGEIVYKTADGKRKEFPGTKPGKIPGEDIPF